MFVCSCVCDISSVLVCVVSDGVFLGKHRPRCGVGFTNDTTPALYGPNKHATGLEKCRVTGLRAGVSSEEIV